VKALRTALAELHSHSRTALNQEADPRYRRMRELNNSSTLSEAELSELRELVGNPRPREAWACPRAEAALEALEAACVPAIERTIEAGAALGSGRRGRRPNWAARSVALVVARYIRDVTGEPPSVWREGGRLGGAYGRALDEIFDAVGLGGDTYRAAEWAITELEGRD
jgi:hypothetical protein